MRLAWSRQEWRGVGTVDSLDAHHRLMRYGPRIGPRVRLWQAKDVPDLLVCRAVAASRAYLDELGECEIGSIRFADSFIMEWTDVPEKVAIAAMERAYDRGLIECGVTLRSGWLTDKGRALLEGL